MARMQGLALPSGNRGLLIMAALAGLAAAVLFVVAVRNNDSKTSGGGTGGAVGNTVVAAEDIPAATRIEEGMLTTKEIPQGLRVESALPDPATVVGQYAAYDIEAGEQITPARIGSATDEGISYVLDRERRGGALQVKEVTAVGGLLYQGDRVDVIATFKVANELPPERCGEPYMLRTETILQNLLVVSVAQEPLQPAGARSTAESDPNTGASGTRPADSKPQPGAATITLQLTPEENQVLVSAQDRARTVFTSLRPYGETNPADVKPLDVCLYE